MNTKQKGDIAVANAIMYFSTNLYEISLPIGDKRDYDMIVEKDNVLSRVQVKYAGLYPKQKSCKVALRITGGNQSFHYSKTYNNNAFDILFVYSAKQQIYVIPWIDIVARNELSIENEKYKKYQVKH